MWTGTDLEVSLVCSHTFYGAILHLAHRGQPSSIIIRNSSSLSHLFIVRYSPLIIVGIVYRCWHPFAIIYHLPITSCHSSSLSIHAHHIVGDTLHDSPIFVTNNGTSLLFKQLVTFSCTYLCREVQMPEKSLRRHE